MGKASETRVFCPAVTGNPFPGVALLIIDMQRDFVSPDSPHCVSEAVETLPVLESILGLARHRAWPIFHVIRQHGVTGGDAEPFRQHHFRAGRGLCISGTPGCEIVDELAPLPEEHVVRKKRFSAFFGTELDDLLQKEGIHTLVITGTQYPNCVRGTAVDALYRDYRTIVVTDACSAQSRDVARSNIFDMRGMGILCIPSRRLDKALAMQE